MKLKILAVDSSAMVASVAILDKSKNQKTIMEDSKLLGEYTINHKKTHSQKLMPMIKELMESLELTPQDIDIYAASCGPGSFTGLRIGITSIKAIAFASEKPVVSVPTLDALAFNIPLTESLVCPIMDARNNQVYTALYKWEEGRQVKITEYMGITITDLIDLVKSKNQKTIFVGDGVYLHGDELKSLLGDYCTIAPGNLLLQRASSVAQLGLIMAEEGYIESCFEMKPFYLRKSQAEQEFEKKEALNE